MEHASRQKACSACIKAKRRCDLGQPYCLRCASRRIDCQYPSRRLHDLPNYSAEEAGHHLSSAPSEYLSDGASDSLGHLVGAVSSRLLFLSPESWRIFTHPPRDESFFDRTALKNLVRKAQIWLQEWVTTGKTAFIHQHLYGDHLPKCIQDAFTVCAAYFSKNTENEELIFGIIEERTSQLVTEHSSLFHSKPCGPNVVDYLAHVQALLVYQIIRLFDGDIRQRYAAESLIPVLSDWGLQMLNNARLSSEYISIAHTGTNYIATECFGEPVWSAWILAESIRRTWMMVVLTQCVYRFLQQGLTACPGVVMFTARAGLWDAPSALLWSEACRGRDMLFMSGTDVDRLLSDTCPDEVDGFVHFALPAMCRPEKIARWSAAWELIHRNDGSSYGVTGYADTLGDYCTGPPSTHPY